MSVPCNDELKDYMYSPQNESRLDMGKLRPCIPASCRNIPLLWPTKLVRVRQTRIHSIREICDPTYDCLQQSLSGVLTSYEAETVFDLRCVIVRFDKIEFSPSDSEAGRPY